MRVVLDTNVVVSGMLNASGPPGRILDLVIAGRLEVLFDDRLISEYLDVLTRPKFGLDRKDIEAVLAFVASNGHPVAAEPQSGNPADPKDLPFIEVAVSAQTDRLITGNVRHFSRAAKTYGFRVVTPGEFIAEGEDRLADRFGATYRGA